MSLRGFEDKAGCCAVVVTGGIAPSPRWPALWLRLPEQEASPGGESMPLAQLTSAFLFGGTRELEQHDGHPRHPAGPC
jgi:hypothetical protein